MCVHVYECVEVDADRVEGLGSHSSGFSAWGGASVEFCIGT